MRSIGLLLLIICLSVTPLQAQTAQEWIAEHPPCDSQNSADREAVAGVLATYDAIHDIERNYSNTISTDSLVDISQEIWNPQHLVCAENLALSLVAFAKLLAVAYEDADVQLDIGNSEDLAPLLEKWLAWAAAFVSEELRTRFWLGSFSDYRGQGIEVGCESYLLPVDTGLARGGNTLAELSQALSALFDPEQKHPAAGVETEDWIKELGLSVAGIHIDGDLAEITLGGQLMGIGTCGDAILEAQILQTVFQFSDIARARITDGETNLRQIVDMSDRFSMEELKAHIYDREKLSWLRD